MALRGTGICIPASQRYWFPCCVHFSTLSDTYTVSKRTKSLELHSPRLLPRLARRRMRKAMSGTIMVCSRVSVLHVLALKKRK